MNTAEELTRDPKELVQGPAQKPDLYVVRDAAILVDPFVSVTEMLTDNKLGKVDGNVDSNRYGNSTGKPYRLEWCFETASLPERGFYPPSHHELACFAAKFPDERRHGPLRSRNASLRHPSGLMVLEFGVDKDELLVREVFTPRCTGQVRIDGVRYLLVKRVYPDPLQ